MSCGNGSIWRSVAREHPLTRGMARRESWDPVSSPDGMSLRMSDAARSEQRVPLSPRACLQPLAPLALVWNRELANEESGHPRA